MPGVEKGSADREALSALGGTGRRLPVSTSVCGGRALTGGWQDLLGACARVCVCPCHPTHHREVTEDQVQPAVCLQRRVQVQAVRSSGGLGSAQGQNP